MQLDNLTMTSTASGSWQDWLFVAGYLSLLVFVVAMVLMRSQRP